MGISCAESQANFAWFDLPVPEGEEAADVEAAVVRGLAERGVHRARGRRARQARRAARDVRDAGAEPSASSTRCASWSDAPARYAVNSAA